MSLKDWWELKVGKGLGTGVHKYDGKGELKSTVSTLGWTRRARESCWSMRRVLFF